MNIPCRAKKLRFLSLNLFMGLMLVPLLALANDELIRKAQEEWFDAQRVPVVGFEIELHGIPQKLVSEQLLKIFGGELLTKPITTRFRDKDGNEVVWSSEVLKHKKTTIGSLRVELDDNGTSMHGFDESNAVVEIVTSPLDYKSTLELELGLKKLQSLGAQGADENHPVALQLNIQIGDGLTKSSVNTNQVLTFLRNYLKLTHRPSIESFLSVKDSRKKYMGLFSQGMMQRIFNPSYRPSQREFYNDFMYRQVLEFYGNELAWSMDLKAVRSGVQKQVIEKGFESILPLMKWNHVRVSSLLMFLFPDDWMSQFLKSTYWFKPYPILEIREPNSDFRISEIYHALLGIYLETQKSGDISIFDRMGGLHKADYLALKKSEEIASGNPWVVRTLPYDGKTDPFIDRESNYYQRIYRVRNSTLVNVTGNYDGPTTYQAGGESVVFHNLPSFQKTLVGKYNPGLANQYIGQFIEHKLREYLFWKEYAPEAMAESRTLEYFYSQGDSVTSLKQRLDKEFPQGWVLKGAYESATQEEYLITNSDNLKGGLEVYSMQYEEFQKIREGALKESSGGNPDILARKIRSHPAFLGWRLKRYLNRPSDAIVQARMDIQAEYRVESIAGKILGGSSTIPRYQYSIPENEDWRNEVEIRKVERFAQSIVNRLPFDLRATPFALDIAVLKDGSVKMVESNPMSNSGFLAFDKRGVKVLNKFLLNYPRLLRNGEVSQGMSVEDQMNYIIAFSKRHEISLDWKNDGLLISLRKQFNQQSSESLCSVYLSEKK